MFRTDVTTPRALKEIKERQVDVIRELHGSGYSYDQLASIFGVKNGAVLRHYVSRDRAPRNCSPRWAQSGTVWQGRAIQCQANGCEGANGSSSCGFDD